MPLLDLLVELSSQPLDFQKAKYQPVSQKKRESMETYKCQHILRSVSRMFIHFYVKKFLNEIIANHCLRKERNKHWLDIEFDYSA